jgi:hypothetical protein
MVMKRTIQVVVAHDDDNDVKMVDGNNETKVKKGKRGK